MSTPDDASSRLSDALEEIFSGSPTLPPRDAARTEPTQQSPAVEPPATQPVTKQPVTEQPVAEEPVLAPPVAEEEPVADWSVDDDEAEEPFELPEIVPATNPLPLADAPAASAVPAPPAARQAPTPAPAPAPATAPAASQETQPGSPATGWGDHMAPLPANAQGAPLRAPGRRPRVRRVTRVLRHIDPWSTFKVALLFSAVAYVVLLTAGVLLWRVADDTGTLANVERWFTQFGWETFELKGGEIFHNAWIIGLFGVVAMTGGLVLLATLFNLVSDIVGGIRLTVLEEEVVERTVSSTRRYVVRRGPTEPGAAATPSQDWDVDGDEPVDDTGGGVVADWSIDDDGDDDADATGDQDGDERPEAGSGAATG